MISQVIRFQSMNGGMKQYSFNIKTTSIPFRKKKKIELGSLELFSLATAEVVLLATCFSTFEYFPPRERKTNSALLPKSYALYLSQYKIPND